MNEELKKEINKRVEDYHLSKDFRINLSRLGLTEIPKIIFDLENLESLDLSENNLSKLPDDIIKLKKLGSLFLHKNKISKFPISTTKLENLEYLMVSSNFLGEIPREVLNFKSLSELKILDNPILIPNVEFDLNITNFTKISHWLREYYQIETPKSNILKIPTQLKTSIKQYLNFFPDFVLQSKGVKINFEVTTVDEGLSLQIHEKDEDSINEINTYLQEYMGLLQHTNEELSIVFTKPVTDFEKELLLTQQRLQIRNLENALDIKELEISYLNEVLKQPILLSHSLIQTLHNATQDAQENLRANNIAIPFIQDGYLWQKMPDGKNIQLEKIEPLKSA